MEKAITITKEKEAQATGTTVFLEVMGASPINKVLDFLIENDRASWSMNEISENANAGYSTLKILLPKMLKNNLLLVDKQIGKIKLYRINRNNEVIKRVCSIYKSTERMALEEFRDSSKAK